MTTILTPITPEELEKIKAGKNFFLLYTKVAPQVGQPLILQAAEDEFSTTIELVHSTPGLMKNCYLLAWNVMPVVIGTVPVAPHVPSLNEKLAN